MYKDIECPYGDYGQDVNHDDGYGYQEDVKHQMSCGNCDKEFVYTTCITFSYDSYKADCLNGGEHKWKCTQTFPRRYSKMYCTDCGDERNPTEHERIDNNLND